MAMFHSYVKDYQRVHVMRIRQFQYVSVCFSIAFASKTFYQSNVARVPSLNAMAQLFIVHLDIMRK